MHLAKVINNKKYLLQLFVQGMGGQERVCVMWDECESVLWECSAYSSIRAQSVLKL